ncbi:hypothetical protein [Paenibacillus rubinfantis]|uniref:hypothetical protein n=1 Tax=Paenibacillus rubinfantis TaxID=1720296 RepID=UPI00073E47D2|nr:hypothetical protein [Paenibacillus rubinfantis]
MPQIAFWGPLHGQVGTTSNTIAAAATLGTVTTLKTLISHTHWAHSTLERAFLKNVSLFDSNFINFTDVGLDALARFAKSRKLEPDMVKDYTHPIIKDRLDLLYGTTKSDETVGELIHVINDILTNASRYYDLTLVDVNSGAFNSLTRAVVQNSDLVVICLNQNNSILERYFGGEWDDFLGDKPRLLVLGQYDRDVHNTYSNISRKFKYKAPIYTVPRCAAFLNAYNESAIMEFFMRNRHVTKRDENYFFFEEVRRLAQGICNQGGINWKMYSERGA